MFCQRVYIFLRATIEGSSPHIFLLKVGLFLLNVLYLSSPYEIQDK